MNEEYIFLGLIITCIFLCICCVIVIIGISYTLSELDDGSELIIKKVIEEKIEPHDEFVFIRDPYLVDSMKNWDVGLLWSIDKDICKVGIVDEFDSSIKYYDIKKKDLRFGVLDAYDSNKLNVYQLWQFDCLKKELEERKLKDGIIISRNLCDSCINNSCIFQSGIVRNHCDFYKTESEE